MKKQIGLLIGFINNPGFVIRIALLLERRGFLLQSMKITDGPFGLSLMELKGEGDPAKKEQIIKQIEKLVDVKSVKELEEPQGLKLKEEKKFLLYHNP